MHWGRNSVQSAARKLPPRHKTYHTFCFQPSVHSSSKAGRHAVESTKSIMKWFSSESTKGKHTNEIHVKKEVEWKHQIAQEDAKCSCWTRPIHSNQKTIDWKHCVACCLGFGMSSKGYSPISILQQCSLVLGIKKTHFNINTHYKSLQNVCCFFPHLILSTFKKHTHMDILYLAFWMERNCEILWKLSSYKLRWWVHVGPTLVPSRWKQVLAEVRNEENMILSQAVLQSGSNLSKSLGKYVHSISQL